MTDSKLVRRVEECAAAVREARKTLLLWQTDAADAQQALDELRDGMGASVLDNPERAAEVTSEIQRLRDRVALAESATAAARPRVVEAERAYLSAEADRLEQSELAPVRAQLHAHNGRTQELLAQLEEHEGRHVLEVDAQRASYDPGSSGPRHFPAPKSGRLQGQVTELERHIKVLRELVEGHDPQPLMTEWNFLGHMINFPDCLTRPDAVVQWRQHLADRAELEALIGA